MRAREYEQLLIQRIARRLERYFIAIKITQDKVHFHDITNRHFELLKVLEEDMGIVTVVYLSGKIEYIKNQKLRHVRNYKKRTKEGGRTPGKDIIPLDTTHKDEQLKKFKPGWTLEESR